MSGTCPDATMSTTRLFCFLLLIGLVPLAGRAQSGTGSVRVARVLEGDMPNKCVGEVAIEAIQLLYK